MRLRAAIDRLGPRVASASVSAEDARTRAELALRRGDRAAAMLALLSVVRGARADAAPHAALAAIYQSLGLPRLAGAEWRTCLAIDPAYGPAIEALARLPRESAGAAR
jgi:Tfp pilus assembly protein PilF